MSSHIIYVRSYMQTRQWHLFLVLVVGLLLKLHSSQGLFFPKTAIWMLQERFLIAKNTCEKAFSALRVSANTQSASGHRLLQCTTIVGRTTSFMPLPPRSLSSGYDTHFITLASSCGSFAMWPNIMQGTSDLLVGPLGTLAIELSIGV